MSFALTTEQKLVELPGADLIAPLVAEATDAAAVATAQAAIATAAAAAIVGRYDTLADALAGTGDGGFAIVGQTLGFADDLYQRVGATMELINTTPTGPGILLTQRIALEGASMAVTQMPLVPLVSVQPAHGKTFDGRIVPPDANTPVSHNAFSSTGASSNGGGGGTFTPNYATDTDGKAVHRWQMTAHAHVLTISPALPAGAVAIKLTIKSNAGAGNQNVTAGLYNHNMSLKAITEGAWTDVVLAVTATASDFAGITNYTDQLPIDMLIKDQCQVYFDGEAVPATEPSRRYALTKRTGFTRAGSIPFGPGNSVQPFDGIIDLRDSTGAAPTFAGMSYVMALREDGASGDNGAVLFTPTATGINYYTVQAGSEYGGLAIRCADAVYNGLSIQGLGWNIVSGRMSASESSVFLNGVSVVESTGHIPVAIPWLHVGGSGPGPAGPFNGLSVPPIFDGSHWSDADMAEMVNVVRDLLRVHGDIVPRRNWYFPEGDSNDVAPGSEGIIWGSQIATNLGLQPYFRLRAAASSTYATLMSRLPFTLKLIEQAVAFGDNVIFSESIGTNPVTGGVMLTLAELRAIWDPVRAAGAKCVSISLKPRGAMDGSTFTNSQRLAFNDMKHNAFLSGYLDGYIDLDSDAIIGDPAVWGYGGLPNSTYVYDDELHWKSALRLRAVDIGQPVIAGLMV